MNSRQLKNILNLLDDPASLDAVRDDVGYQDMVDYLCQVRDDINDLRVRNQELHMQIARFDDLLFLAQKARQALRIEALERIGGLKKKIAPLRRAGRYLAPARDTPPYHARILHPLLPRRPRILHAIGNFMIGGSSRLVVDLFEHLGHRFEQAIITRDRPCQPSYTGVSLHEYKRFKNPKQALACLKTFQPDILHVHYLGHHRSKYSERDWRWYNNIFQAAEQYGCKVVENINIPVEPYVSQSVSAYVYVSDYVKCTYGSLEEANTTIYPGSDLALFSRKSGMEIPDDCIGMVYRLEGDKLNERSIDVFIKVVQRRSATKVLIVGGGRYLESYRVKVDQAGVGQAFTFKGYVPYAQLPSLFAQMSIFVAPVHRESFGQVSPFAMHMEIPVVGYDVGALDEIIENRALLVPPEDSDALADLIVSLLDDRERRRLGNVLLRRAR